VFGVVENMGYYVCPCCGELQPLFPDADVPAMASGKHVPYLGAIPLDPQGQGLADHGEPLTVSCPDSPAAAAFSGLADALVQALERERRQSLRDADPDTRAGHEAFWERLMED
jgi:ATP-binding protein involved in chromosome partitioning